jgi:16S rRNA (guanine527-N7)-methyltransferase
MDNTENITAIFSAGLAEMHLKMNPSAQEKMLNLLNFLKKWNKRFNLTAVTDLSKMVSYHLLDSLSIVPYIQGDSILDFGSGAGFPGVPLAVYFPQKHWVLLDSNGKKTRFLTQLKSELDLSNVDVVHARAETWQTPQKFSQIVCRAVGSVKDIIEMTRHFLLPKGQWLLMKGEHEHEDFDTIPYPFVIEKLQVPGVHSSRYLVIVKS